MRTVDDLRVALRQETTDLQPALPVAGIRDRARRRTRRRRIAQATAAMAAGLTAATIGVLASTRPVAVPRPEPLAPLPSVSIAVDPSFPPLGHVIRTGARVGEDEELVLWFSAGSELNDGLLNLRTGTVRDLDALGGGMMGENPPPQGFQALAQIDDRRGGLVDYGLFVGTPGAIVGQTHSGRYATHLASWSEDRRYVVFWADHAGTPLPTDSNNPYPAGADLPRFVAYSESGRQLATSDGLVSRRTDAGLNLADSTPVGQPVDTGVRLADGGRLRLWFVGSGTDVLLKAGSVKESGTVTELKALGVFHTPLQAIGFYHGLDMFDGPDGTHILVGEYAGPAAKVTAGAPGAGVVAGSARWSAHPELTLYWVAGVSTANYPNTFALAYDGAGTVVDLYKFNE